MLKVGLLLTYPDMVSKTQRFGNHSDCWIGRYIERNWFIIRQSVDYSKPVYCPNFISIHEKEASRVDSSRRESLLRNAKLSSKLTNDPTNHRTAPQITGLPSHTSYVTRHHITSTGLPTYQQFSHIPTVSGVKLWGKGHVGWFGGDTTSPLIG